MRAEFSEKIHFCYWLVAHRKRWRRRGKGGQGRRAPRLSHSVHSRVIQTVTPSNSHIADAILKPMKAVKKNRPTFGLAMIMKDEIDDLDRIVKDYGKYFDKIYVTATEKKTFTKLRKLLTENSKVELSYFKWIDHFGKARLYNQKRVETDYWMWLDMDDEIEGVEYLRAVIEHMDMKKYDTAIFQYEIIRPVNLSDPRPILWRERIVKTASKLKWIDEPVHEKINIQSDTKQVVLSEVMIKHYRTAKDTPKSVERNKLILERDWRRKRRPLTAWHLGATLRELGDYEGAIEKLLFAAKRSKNKAYRFTAWQSLCECYYQTRQYGAAIDAISECIAIDPDHPEPYYQGFAVFRAMGYHDLAMQSAESALSKKVEGTLAIILGQDQSWHQYRGPFEVAQAYLEIGNVERAYELYQQVKKIAPRYIEEVNRATGARWDAVFEQAHKDKFAVD